jgi:alginate O-acetyltransferase complex protein AlgI
MLFSSISFLYYFLPTVLAIYFILPNKAKNLVLFLASLFFYFWGEPIYTIVMIVSALSGYIHGLLIEKFRGTKKSKAALVSSLIVGLGLLGIFKYTDFFISNINEIFNSSMSLLKIALPIGISFYTFQILSYTIDLYRGNAKVQKNFINFATYVFLFPQLIAGPIVRYVDVERELNERKHSFEMIGYGISRFIIGLSKKVLLANTLGEFCEIAKATAEPSVLFWWAYAIAYALHIYFDFSGYSDMAIGLGRIFGFKFMENFNYPYISKSVTEFWRRWHISLSSWFRDYVYIPLGGNRVSKLKWIRNILIVWGLTGFWHGAGWNFIFWGLLFAVILTLEKTILKSFIEKCPQIITRSYVGIIILISWVLFDAPTINIAVDRIKSMFGVNGLPLISAETVYYIVSYASLFILGFIAATPLVKQLVLKAKQKDMLNKIINTLEPIVMLGLFVLCTACLIDGSFNPFLYFRF